MEKNKKELPHYYGHFERLRERFLKDNGKSMPDYELLELLLHEINIRHDVKPLAKRLLDKYGSFVKLITAPKEGLEKSGLTNRGISLLKIVECAAKRLCERVLNENNGSVFLNWDYIIDYCRSHYAYESIEMCGLIFLNLKNEVMRVETIQKGTINHVTIYIREVIKDSLLNGAAGLILCHNHPSGCAQPSMGDIEVTYNLLKSTMNIDINLVDHIIITQNDHFSFRENNLLDVDSLSNLILGKTNL